MGQGKLPAFMFYPGDWLKDPKLRVCSHAAKGVLIDLLCIMFECEERGILATARTAWTDDEIVRSVGGDQCVTLACLHELLDRRILHRTTNTGAVFSARMVRDEEQRRSNAQRQARFKARKAGNALVTGEVTPQVTHESQRSSYSSSVSRDPPNPPSDQKTEPDPPSPPGESVFDRLEGWELAGLAGSLQTPEIRQLLAEFVLSAREKGANLSAISWRRQLAHLASLGRERTVAALKYSIRQGYKGIHEPDGDRSERNRESKPSPMRTVVRGEV